ncbi:helix-turn-helix domain-containing protein [Thermoactinomyces sp. CICC 10522]|jgi:transcriptional regulator with XRE-family HTH domain|uniref:helix-turn-helix domain-containing protein n=1 Tax=Thermoactinomyces sp. CICC 10522 TaxID=2767427 RepID=UPI0018DD91F1|nr:helix-turn-helix transcriptional regulator [Thermoactinomyces sp. CICC 10522]MBH8605581.1 helix-turn-helix transcriptional regulator [Thermoactinomyces sp. CICC 10522]
MSDPKNHEELMELLESVPGVKEAVYSFSRMMGRAIFARRIELGLTQKELAQRVQEETGQPMHQSVISRIEGGSTGITSETYDRILRVLGMKDIEIIFDTPKEIGATISSLPYAANEHV